MKKRKTKLPNIPFNYGFYVVYWKDIESDPSWKEMSEVLKSKPAVCVSTGWLIKKDEEVHILITDFNYKKDGTLGDAGSSTVIPSSNIIKLVKVNLNV